VRWLVRHRTSSRCREIRRSSSFNTDRIDHIYQDPHEKARRLILHYGDLNDASSLNRILRLVRRRGDLQPRRAEPGESLVRRPAARQRK
jgi:hypothetical protein